MDNLFQNFSHNSANISAKMNTHLSPLTSRFFPYLLITLLTTFFLLPTSSQSTILTVKQDGTGDFTVIQEAYLSASSGDTLLVWPGTYYENLHVTDPNKDITIASLYLTTLDRSYINSTIIDGNNNGSCIAMYPEGEPIICINGFTLQNGSGYGDRIVGGAIYVNNPNPKIENNIIKDCFALTGGGMYLYDTETTLSGNIIKNNHSNSFGGGIFLAYNATIVFDTILKNSVFLNYAGWGADVCKTMFCPELYIVVDTMTVLNPDVHFILSYDDYGFPMDDISISIENAKITPIDNDLYVNPTTGNNSNSGLSPEEALKTIAFALKKIYPDSLNPNSIILSNGTYALSTNGEKLPVSARSYVSILGTHKDSTIVDAEHLTKIFNSSNGMKNYQVSNISFINGFGNHYNISNMAGLYLSYNENIMFNNISVSNNISSVSPGIVSFHGNNTNIYNSEFANNQGGWPVQIGNTSCSGYQNTIMNCIVNNNGPDDQPIIGMGGGISINGSSSIPDAFLAILLNVQITENLNTNDPMYLSGTTGLKINNHSKCFLINATIGNNINIREMGGAVGVDDGGILEVYNSIFYKDSVIEMNLGAAWGSNFPATANIAYSNIEGGEGEIMNWYNQHTLNWLDGNMDEDPLWAGTGDTAYYLLPGSPCINAGTPMYEEGMDYPYIKMEGEKIVLYKYDGDTIHLPATDLAGKPRISGGRIDMGAYEYQDTTTGIDSPDKINREDKKVQVYPNPFSAHTFITFRMQNQGNIVVKISDINGRPVKTLMDAKISKGEYNMTWKGDDDYGTIVKKGTYMVTFYLNGTPVETVKVVKRNSRRF
nr:T9SS type A sorting domain-containing protein [Bacteroidota bacterium]